jgi:urate oxidase
MSQDAAHVVLTQAQYGKAEVRLLHVDRAGERHEIADLNVSIALAGDLTDTYLTGDNTNVLTTDAQKNTVYAFARKFGVNPVEEFALRLASHFAGTGPVERAQVRIEQYGWERIGARGAPHPHSSSGRRGPASPACSPMPTGGPRSWRA